MERKGRLEGRVALITVVTHLGDDSRLDRIPSYRTLPKAQPIFRIRNSSRSAHFCADFPTRDDVNRLQHILAFRGANGGHELQHEIVTDARFQPEERRHP